MSAWLPLLPILAATGAALLLLLAEVGVRRRRVLPALALGGLAAVVASVLACWYSHPGQFHFGYFAGRFVVDRFALFMTLVFALGAGVTVVIGWPHLEREGLHRGEFHALVLFAVVGMIAMACATDLMGLFLGLEVMSLALYALVGFLRRRVRANEAALKYFFLGAFSAGLFLYGIALCYGASGGTTYAQLALAAAAPARNPLLVPGVLLILVGLAFKVGAAPFHMWVPDVYEGAPTPVTGFMSTAVKAAGFAALLRLLGVVLPLGGMWWPLLWVLAVLTMVAGNVFALVQHDVKRMLAYSSVAHTGYLLVGLVALVAGPAVRQAATSAVLYYLVAYAFTTLGAFAVVAYLGRRAETATGFDDLAGVAARHPWLAAGMAVCMASFIGLPPTAGFFGKLSLFTVAVRAGHPELAVIGVLNSLLSIAYYLRVVVAMYWGAPAGSSPEGLDLPGNFPRLGRILTGTVLAYLAFAVIWTGTGQFAFLGVVPGVANLFGWARAGALALL